MLDALRVRDVDLFTGVPCSFLTPLIDQVISDPEVRYLGATSEGESTGIAIGAWLGGGSPLVLCQNSGLGNMVNPLTSLAHPCRMAFPIICTWRGEPGTPDEPQHDLMGRKLVQLLDTIELGFGRLPADVGALDSFLDRAWEEMEQRQVPFCFVMSRGGLQGDDLDQPEPGARSRGERWRLGESQRIRRAQALEAVMRGAGDEAALIATTGKTGRELFATADRPQHFYHVGAMGCASATGLGLSLHTHRPVVVLDGDAAALMKLGNLATIGVAGPENLLHVVLDNGVHDSTGGQRTASWAIDFADVALSCGYRSAVTCDSTRDLEESVAAAVESKGPHFIHTLIRPGSPPHLPRPNLHPSEVARRFRSWVTEHPPSAYQQRVPVMDDALETLR